MSGNRCFRQQSSHVIVSRCLILGMGASVRKLLLPLMVVCGTSLPGYSQQSSLRTTLREALAHTSQFDGKRVQFHARYSGTFEGMWLGDSEALGEVVLPFDRQLQARYGVE